MVHEHEQRLLRRQAVVERMTMTEPPQREDDARATIERRTQERSKNLEYPAVASAVHPNRQKPVKPPPPPP